jgi:hypothetical protein
MRINNHSMSANPSMAVTQAFIYKPGFNLLDFQLQKETTLRFCILINMSVLSCVQLSYSIAFH